MLDRGRRCLTILLGAYLAAMFVIASKRSPIPAASAAKITTVPSPTQRADRFGIYNWNIDDTTFPGGTRDRLNWGADKVAAIGSRTIHVFLGVPDIYQVNPPNAPDLAQIAASPAYDHLFRDPRFRTYFLTVYSSSDLVRNWADGYTPAEYQTERDEIRRLGEYLLGNANYADKTFIIVNWEGDNDIYAYHNKRTAWEAYKDWVRSRVDGVKDARLRYPGDAARLYSGLEFNRVTRNGAPCGSTVSDPVNNDPLQSRCVIDYVAPQVEIDYYYYSAWESLLVKDVDPGANLKDRLKADLGFALAKVKAKRPEVTEANFVVGEFGFARMTYGECTAANYLIELFDAVKGEGAFQVSYAIFWQIADDKRWLRFSPNFPGHGLYKTRDGQLRQTLLGRVFQRRLANQPVADYTGCPSIRRPPPAWGVLDAVSGEANLHLNPDSVLAIYVKGCCQSTEAPFSRTGNLVHFDQGLRQYLLPQDNPQSFYESETQINASLPAGRRPGEALVYVTNNEQQGRIDSNAQVITLDCADCPSIRPACSILDAQSSSPELQPGAAVSIFGSSFSPAGNTVTVEQQDDQNIIHRYILPRDGAWSESPEQIRATLPSGLIPGLDALIYVTNAGGRESNGKVITVSGACSNCSPVLNSCFGIRNEQGQEFHPGTVVSIYGLRFSASGNKVIVEQTDAQGAFSRQVITQGSPRWGESYGKVTASLPTALLPGRALVYVIDSQGRETDAQEIRISATAIKSVSAASFSVGPLATESIVAAFGNALATTTQAAATVPLPTSLAGTTVRVRDSAGMERLAPLFFVSPGQINYQIPEGTAVGAATVTVTSGDGSISSEMVEIASVVPSLFAANASGQGVAAAVALRVRADGSQTYEPVAEFDAAQQRYVSRPIDLGPDTDQVFLILFGTGIRYRSSLAAVAARVGDAGAAVEFAGPQGEFVGLDQINLRLPRSLAGRGEIDVALSVGSKAANIVRISVR